MCLLWNHLNHSRKGCVISEYVTVWLICHQEKDNIKQ